jgi:hypothetical protein
MDQALIIISSAIFAGLGSLHQIYTFYGGKLNPRNQSTIDAMKTSKLILSRQNPDCKTCFLAAALQINR